MVDEEGLAVIMKNNKSCYVIAPFSEYDEIVAWKRERNNRIDKIADKVLEDNLEAFQELAK
jgi:antitoxin Phd